MQRPGATSRIIELTKSLELMHFEAEHRLCDLRADPYKFPTAHDEEFLKIIAPCRSLVSKIESELERCMGERQRRIYRLGWMMEQINFQDDAFRATHLWCSPTYDHETSEPPKCFALANPLYRVRDLTSDWLVDLKTSLRNCGFPESMDPPADNLWLPHASKRLRARLTEDGVSACSINGNLAEYQVKNSRPTSENHSLRMSVFRPFWL